MFATDALPTGVYDWIFAHGMAGLMLVISTILGWTLLKREALLQEKERERTALEVEYRKKVEELKGETIKKLEDLLSKYYEKAGSEASLAVDVRDALKAVLDTLHRFSLSADRGGHGDQ